MLSRERITSNGFSQWFSWTQTLPKRMLDISEILALIISAYLFMGLMIVAVDVEDIIKRPQSQAHWIKCNFNMSPSGLERAFSGGLWVGTWYIMDQSWAHFSCSFPQQKLCFLQVYVFCASFTCKTINWKPWNTFFFLSFFQYSQSSVFLWFNNTCVKSVETSECCSRSHVHGKQASDGNKNRL